MIERKRILQRLKIARGHLDYVMKMVDRNDNVFEILQQSKAVQNALRNSSLLILEQHLRNCVFNDTNKQRQLKALEEISGLIKQSKPLSIS